MNLDQIKKFIVKIIGRGRSCVQDFKMVFVFRLVLRSSGQSLATLNPGLLPKARRR